MNETENNEEQPAETTNTNTNSHSRIENLESGNGRSIEESNAEALEIRSDLLDFSARSDGSVNCKLCGNIFASRQHWYRHKYRVHVVNPPVNPVPLNKCERCLIFFKTRKGYLGHMSSKHSATLQDATPVLRNEQDAAALVRSPELRITRVENPAQSDPELDIPKTIMQNCQALPAPARVPKRNASRTRGVDRRRATQASGEIEPNSIQDRRVTEESIVMGIIEKVRRQCATEPEGATRRGYSRKPYSARI